MKKSRKIIGIAVSAAVLLFCAGDLLAQRVSIPAGTVIELRMDTGLSSGNSRVNDAFSATVSRSVRLDGRIAVPRDSKIDGRVSMVQPAMRGSKSGVIGVTFTQLTIEGRRYPINGTLTSLRADERGQIMDREGGVQGGSSAGRNTVFIGGGVGAGAAIGAMAGGGKGAGAGAAIGGGLGVLGALLSKGAEAEVPAGSDVAVELGRAVNVAVSNAAAARPGREDDRTLYVSTTLVRGAQTALMQRRYYQGPINGTLDNGTRRAIAHFQIDNRQPATGDLDQATAMELGLIRDEGNRGGPGGPGRGNNSSGQRR